MRIVTLNPPFLDGFSRESRSPAVAKSGTLYYPMWLGYATGVLEDNGFEVNLIDAPARRYHMQFVQERIQTYKPRLVVVDTSTPSIKSDVRVAEDIKHIAPDAFVVLVGRHVSALPDETMEMSSKIDGVAMGEYDYIVRDLACALRDDQALSNVKGLLWRDRDTNQLVKNEPMPLIGDLDSLSFVSSVYKKHLNIGDYFYGHSRYPVVTIVTGRGCSHHCFYCCYPQTMFGHKSRKRSPENIADEFKFIADTFPQAKEIMLEDDTLTADSAHAERLAEALLSVGNRIPFSANSRADLVDVDILKKLRRSGCRLLCVGYESGDQDILNNIHKDLTIERALEFSKATREAHILVHGCFMVGNPGETKETMEKTLNYAKRLNPDTAQFYPLMVYPGTEAFNWAQDSGYLLTTNYADWLTEDGLHATTLERPHLSSRYLTAFCNRARREFYLRPRYILRKILQSLGDVQELKRNVKGFGNLVRFLFKNEEANG